MFILGAITFKDTRRRAHFKLLPSCIRLLQLHATWPLQNLCPTFPTVWCYARKGRRLTWLDCCDAPPPSHQGGAAEGRRDALTQNPARYTERERERERTESWRGSRGCYATTDLLTHIPAERERQGGEKLERVSHHRATTHTRRKAKEGETASSEQHDSNLWE